MVYALSQIHGSLFEEGILLDVHPQPVNSHIEIRHGELVHELGEIDQSEDNREIEDARSRLQLLLDQGRFAAEEADYFELAEIHDSVAGWQERWAREDYRLVAPPEMLETAEKLLSTGGGELVIREQVRATRLRRLGGVADQT